MPRPTFGLPLTTRTLLLAGTLGVGGVAALSAWAFPAAEQRVVDEEVRRSSAVGQELLARVDAAQHEAFAALYPDAKAVWSWYGHGTFLRELHQDFADTAARHGLSTARTVRPVEPMAEAVRSGPKERQKAALEVFVAAADAPTWRARIDYQPEMRDSWRKGKVTSRLVKSEKRGDRVQTWLPLRDRHGSTLALLELEAPVTAQLAAARRQTAWLVAGAAATVLALCAGLALLARPSDQAREAAVKALRRLGRQGLEGKLKHGGDALLWEIEATRAALAAKLDHAEGRADGAEAQARSVEALIGGAATERRQILAGLVSEGALVVDAGGTRREQANLVDLSFNHLVLKVQKYTLIDLAPGMVARVGWVEGGGEEVELTVTHRNECEDGAEYAFALERNATLPGTPHEVAAVAFARGAERVSAEFTEITATLLAGLGGALPATVLDVSADGLGLAVPVRPVALGATGTHATLMLTLALGEEEMQFGVLIRSVSPTESGCRLGIQFDPEMTSDYEARRAKVAAWVNDRMRQLALASATGAEYAA